MWPTLELRDVQIFLTLTEELHFGRTGERTGLTRSRVSQKIRQLERHVGAPLFERSTRHVTLTTSGEELLRELRPAYEQMQQAFTRAREAAAVIEGTLRFGMSTPLDAGPHLSEIIKTFQNRHPACRVQTIDSSFARRLLDELYDDHVDVMALSLPLTDPNLIIGPTLTREERALIVAIDHPLATRGSVSYEDLGGHTIPLISQLPAEVFEAACPPQTRTGQPVHRTEVHTQGELIMRIVRGETVLPAKASFLDYFHHPHLAIIPMTGLPPAESALVWLRRNQSRTIEAFARAATDVVQDGVP